MRGREDGSSTEDKVKALERILKAITYAEEITYHGKGPTYIRFHDADPRGLKLRGYSEGLDLDWDAEPYERAVHFVDELEDKLEAEATKITDARLVGEVWLFDDPWKKIEWLETHTEALRKELKKFIVVNKQLQEEENEI